MKGTRLCFVSPEKVIVEQFDVREPKDNEVQVKIHYTLISNGTEKANLKGDYYTGKVFPRIPGYSSVGEVVKCGSSVKEFKVGDRVFVGRGGHASYNIRSTSWCEKIPDNVSYLDAVFTRMISFPLLALRRSAFEIGESVVVVGLGQLGLFGCQLAKIAGALPVIAIGNRDLRRKKAIDFGADLALDPSDPELKSKVIQNTRITGSEGADVVIETSGNIEGLEAALQYTTTRGRIVISGCYWQENHKPVNMYSVNLNGYTIIGAQDKVRPPYNSQPFNWTRKRDFKAILGLISDGRLTPKLIEPEIYSPNQAPEIYNLLLTDRNFPLGVIFDWEHF